MSMTPTEALFLLELVTMLQNQIGEKDHKKLVKRMGSDVIRSTRHKLQKIRTGDPDVQCHSSGQGFQ